MREPRYGYMCVRPAFPTEWLAERAHWRRCGCGCLLDAACRLGSTSRRADARCVCVQRRCRGRQPAVRAMKEGIHPEYFEDVKARLACQ